MEEHQRRHEGLAVGMIAAYAAIMKLLTALPLPIGLPPVKDGGIFGAEVREGLIRANTALADLPMEEEAQRWLNQMITDWMAATDLLFAEAEDPADWMLDFVENQVIRILLAGELVEEILF